MPAKIGTALYSASEFVSVCLNQMQSQMLPQRPVKYPFKFSEFTFLAGKFPFQAVRPDTQVRITTVQISVKIVLMDPHSFLNSMQYSSDL